MANTHSIDLELSSSQYLSITDAAQTGLDITTDFSVEAWIKLEQLPSVSGTIFTIVSKDDGSATNGRGYIMFINTDDKLYLDWIKSSTANLNRRVSDAVIVSSGEVGTWIHVAGTADISVPSGVLYKDGSSVASTQAFSQSTTIEANAEDFYIGAWTNNTGVYRFFDGLIDEVRIWNDIRTATEILDNYQTELVGDEANLQGYWKLNNSLLDETANNNDLTNNNSAVFSTDVPFVGATFIPKIMMS